MPDTRKAGPVLLQNPINLSVSFFVKYPSEYNSFADLTPKGKPHNIPSMKGYSPILFILKIRSKKRPVRFRRLKLAFAYKKSDKTINGKTDGIITFAHSDSPDFTE